jgi:hypothetical protein
VGGWRTLTISTLTVLRSLWSSAAANIPWGQLCPRSGVIDHNVTTTEQGEFWRLLIPGTYTITVSAMDHEPNTVENIVVTLEQRRVLEVEKLTPTADLDSNLTPSFLLLLEPKEKGSW